VDVEQMLCTGPYGSGARLAANAGRVEQGLIRLLNRLTGASLPVPHRSLPLETLVLVGGTATAALPLLDGPAHLPEVQRLVAETLAATDPIRPGSALAVGPYGQRLLQPATTHPDALALITARAKANLCASGAAAAFALVDGYPATLTRLAEAILLLRRVVPALAGSTLPYVAGVALLADCDVESAYLAPTPNLVYLNPDAHPEVGGLADALLHEALHQKRAHIRLTRALYRPGYDDFSGPQVPIPWGDRGFRTFSVGRALAAAHVYVHLTALHVALLRTGEGGGLTPDAVRRRLLVRAGRAAYLVDALSTPRYRAELGADAPDFLAWLAAAQRGLEDSTVEGTPLAAVAQDPGA
jgi:hypothetical protein